MPVRDGVGWTVAGLYVVSCVAHLWAQFVVDPFWIVVTIWLPVLLLLVWFAITVRRWDRLAVLVTAGLTFSWLGDTFGSGGLDVKIAFFLVAQVCYVVAFLRPFRELWAGRRWWLHLRWLPYLIAVVGLMVVVVPRSGVLAPAVVGYALGIGLMAVFATSLGRVATVGGALFVVSDGLLAIQEFTFWRLPLQGLLIMATYLAAQAALAYAVASRSRRS